MAINCILNVTGMNRFYYLRNIMICAVNMNGYHSPAAELRATER